MSEVDARDGIVYTETVVYAPPEQYTADVPYQLAIIDLRSGQRVTVRILGKEMADRAQIGDAVTFVDERNGVAYYKRSG